MLYQCCNMFFWWPLAWTFFFTCVNDLSFDISVGFCIFVNWCNQITSNHKEVSNQQKLYLYWLCASKQDPFECFDTIKRSESSLNLMLWSIKYCRAVGFLIWRATNQKRSHKGRIVRLRHKMCKVRSLHSYRTCIA